MVLAVQRLSRLLSCDLPDLTKSTEARAWMNLLPPECAANYDEWTEVSDVTV